MRRYFVYILASHPYGTLYIGVTNDLLSRVAAHRAGQGSRFTERYGIGRLVYYEMFANAAQAIQREKSLKRYNRGWKFNLIARENPNWDDLYPKLRALPGNAIERPASGLDPRDKPEDDGVVE